MLKIKSGIHLFSKQGKGGVGSDNSTPNVANVGATLHLSAVK